MVVLSLSCASLLQFLYQSLVRFLTIAKELDGKGGKQYPINPGGVESHVAMLFFPVVVS